MTLIVTPLERGRAGKSNDFFKNCLRKLKVPLECPNARLPWVRNTTFGVAGDADPIVRAVADVAAIEGVVLGRIAVDEDGDGTGTDSHNRHSETENEAQLVGFAAARTEHRLEGVWSNSDGSKPRDQEHEEALQWNRQSDQSLRWERRRARIIICTDSPSAQNKTTRQAVCMNISIGVRE